MNTTDTPRTDAFFNRTDIEWDDEVLFARKLERELDASQAEVERLKKMVMEAAELGDKRSDTFKSRAEKAEASLIKINEELCQAGLREYVETNDH